ncbi:MAG: hypothetical protein OEW46_05315 [Actinomycetota bacterium]|nr:hypothetical protein [Actinomycetota bacterium]
MRTSRAWIRSFATFAGLTLLLAGCLKLDMAITISPDDTVDGEMVFAVNKDLLELTGQSVDDLIGDTSLPSDVEGATQEPYEDDRFVGTRVMFEDVALADMQDASDPDSLSIVRNGDTYEVSGVMDLTTDAADQQDNPFGDQVTEAFDTAELRIAVTFPGEVIEANGKIDGTTVTWEPVFGERTELTAVASASGEGDTESGGTSGTDAAGGASNGSSGNTLLYVILGLALIGGVIGVFLLMRGRGRDGAAQAAPNHVGTADDQGTPAAPAPPPSPGPGSAESSPAPPPTPPPPTSIDPPEDGSGG